MVGRWLLSERPATDAFLFALAALVSLALAASLRSSLALAASLRSVRTLALAASLRSGRSADSISAWRLWTRWRCLE